MKAAQRTSGTIAGRPAIRHGRFAAWLALVGLLVLLLAPLAAPGAALAQDSDEAPIVPSESSAAPTDEPAEVVLDEPAEVVPDDPAAQTAQATQTQSDATTTTAVPPSDWAPPRTVYIPETGHTIDGLFLDLWREWGGANAFGYPITPEFEEDGRIVQYYGYARFEYWPEGDADGNYVTLGKVGAELRPHVIPRSLPAVSNGTNRFKKDDERARAAREAMLAARAWLPLDRDEAPADSETYRFVPETGHGVLDGFKALWEATGAEVYLGNPLTEEYVRDGVTYQIFERGQMAWQPGYDPWLVPVGELMAARKRLPTAPVARGDIPTYSEQLFVPPPPPSPAPQSLRRDLDPSAEKWIEVSISQQYLIAWQGNVPVFESYVSTGRQGFDTPPGSYHILTKVESEDMEGVIGGEYYNVPAVPWTMYFTNVGHAIHGTYWHSNFGTPMSHGCVNLPESVAKAIYDWASIGIRVEVKP